MPIYSEEKRSDQFRSASAVAVHIKNFAGMDPESDYVGRGESERQREVWERFGHRPDATKKLANRIQETAADIEADSLDSDSLQTERFSEGAILTYEHKRRERNAQLVEKKKKKVLRETGSLDCEACGFNFADFYADLLETPFAECHHRTPLPELEGSQKTTVDDLAILCPNCHRAIHRTDPMISVSELRAHVPSV